MPKVKASDKARVLIVDERIISATLAAVLLHHDFAVIAFTEGKSALKAARCAKPDLLIAEPSMSPFSGIDLALLLQQREPSCKVLLFCGQLESEAPLQAARSNGLEFETISKPVAPKELLNKVLEMTAGLPHSLIRNRALQTYRENARETLSSLRANFGKHTRGRAN